MRARRRSGGGGGIRNFELRNFLMLPPTQCGVRQGFGRGGARGVTVGALLRGVYRVLAKAGGAVDSGVHGDCSAQRPDRVCVE